MSKADDADLVESMNAFEAALIREPTEIPPHPIKNVLLAIDRSNQDEAAKTLAREVRTRTGARLLVAFAYEGEREEAREAYLGEIAKELEAAAVWGEGTHTFERILSAVKTAEADLLVIPAPYLADLDLLGHESLGTSLDLVLARANVPVLVVRDPSPTIAATLDQMLIPITFANRENPRACGLALALAGSSTRIELLAVADRRLLTSASHLLGSYLDVRALDPATLEALEAKEHASLIAALQKTCAEKGLDCRVQVEVGDPVDVVRIESEASPRLTIVAAPEDHREAAFQQVLALLKDARNPVLVV